jgi:arylsulfatase A-like enzyme
MVVADSLRPDFLGCYGGPARTPTLDALAAGGARFEKVLSSSPWTLPSFAALLTGCFAHRLGLVHWKQPWPAHPATLFQRFARAGRPVASFVFDPQYLFTGLPEAGVRGASLDDGELFGAIRALQEPDGLIFIHYWGTHVPYVHGRLSMGTWKRLSDGILEVLQQAPGQRDKVRAVYQLAVEHFSERWLPGLLDALRAGPGPGDTLLVMLADHGETWGERLPPGQSPRGVFDLHGNALYEESVRVPLIVHGAGVPAGRVIGGMARTVDLAPTLLELAGLPPATDAEELDGVSLRACLEQGTPAPTRLNVAACNTSATELAFANQVEPTPAQVWTRLGLWEGRHKWLVSADGTEVVRFDLPRDPGESRPLKPCAAERAHVGALYRRELARARALPLPPEALEEAERLAEEARRGIARRDSAPRRAPGY